MTAMKKKRNAFTLVELLVVIAILAILATVSVIGYTAFVNRANESNALSEMTQARDLIRAELMDGEVHTYDDKNSPDNESDDVSLQLTDDALVIRNVTDLGTVLTDLTQLKGTFTLNKAEQANEDGTTDVVSITYTLESGEATATWTIAKDTITTDTITTNS